MTHTATVHSSATITTAAESVDVFLAPPVLGMSRSSVSALHTIFDRHVETGGTWRDGWSALKAFDRKAERYGDLRYLRGLLSGSSLSKCSMAARPNGTGGVVNAQIRRTPDYAFLSGVLMCKGVWLCPLCAPKILSGRGEQIEAIQDHVDAVGATSLLVSLTLPHWASDSLDALFPVVSNAGAMFSHRAWRNVADDLDYVGVARSIETTFGANGWHPHWHGLMVFDTDLTDAQVARIRGTVQQLWSDRVAKLLGRSVVDDIAVDVRRWVNREGTRGVGHYITKLGKAWTVGQELAGGVLKDGREGSLTPGQLVRMARHGDPQAERRVREFYRVTKRAKRVYIAPALTAWAGIDDTDDDDLVATMQDAELVTELSPTVLSWIVRFGAETDVIFAGYYEGQQGIVETLRARGLRVVATTRDGPDGAVPVIELPPSPEPLE